MYCIVQASLAHASAAPRTSPVTPLATLPLAEGRPRHGPRDRGVQAPHVRRRLTATLALPCSPPNLPSDTQVALLRHPQHAHRAPAGKPRPFSRLLATRYSLSPFVPPQLLLYLALAPEEKIRFIEGGERAVTKFEEGVAGYESRAYRGLGVFTSTPYEYVARCPHLLPSPVAHLLTCSPAHLLALLTCSPAGCRTTPTRCRCSSGRRRSANTTA